MTLHQRTSHQILRLSACAIAVLALGACGETDSDVPSTSGSSSSSPTESESESAEPTESAESAESPTSTPTSTPEQPQLIDYSGDGSKGVKVQEAADVEKLDGAPDAFKQFIARTAERVSEEATCDGAGLGVTVETLRTDGFAAGVVNDCDGYIALWALVDGKWKEVQSTLDLWNCRVLERYSFPSAVAGTGCYDDEVGDVREYSQA